MTEALRSTLVDIFVQYGKQDDVGALDPDNVKLGYTEAARLWYRSGLKLSLLSETQLLSQEDFLSVFERICAEDESKVVTSLPQRHVVQVGDFVELVEGYDKLGDAAGGPLALSERGLVVEIQNGADGETKSVRVLS